LWFFRTILKQFNKKEGKLAYSFVGFKHTTPAGQLSA
jgi:hypothetical protein